LQQVERDLVADQPPKKLDERGKDGLDPLSRSVCAIRRVIVDYSLQPAPRTASNFGIPQQHRVFGLGKSYRSREQRVTAIDAHPLRELIPDAFSGMLRIGDGDRTGMIHTFAFNEASG